MSRELPSDQASRAQSGLLIQKYWQLSSRKERTQLLLLLLSRQRVYGIIALTERAPKPNLDQKASFRSAIFGASMSVGSWPARFCGMLLGDMGADLIKVDPPGIGRPDAA
jgi:hypothetical protein